MSCQKRPRPDAREYTVGWICALPLELSAALGMLDEEHAELHVHSIPYTLGRVGLHNVVVACLPAGQMGTNSAAGVASQMMSDFKSIQYGLLVGIGGGVPSPTTDIRLGDVVISQPHLQYPGVVQYDFGKTEEGGRSSRIGSLNSPPTILLASVSKLMANEMRGRNGITKHLQQSDLSPIPTRQSPGADVLFEAAYAHAEGSSCIACDRNRVVQRTPRKDQSPMIHCGTIASGNQVMKDGVTRDRLSANLGGGVLCFEMEAAGLMNSFPCLVIRGICDYADSHKNKGWQTYASAAAAACAKEVLYITPGVECVGLNSRGSSHDRLVYGQGLSMHMEPSDHPSVEISIPHNVIKSSSVGQRRQALTQSLSFAEIDVRHATIQNAYTETCKWLLDRPEYQDWRDPSKLSEHHGFFWLKGKPGTGKSTMMKFAYANAIKTMTDTTIVCFFFNARGTSLEKSVDGLYRSLLSQLLDKLPDLQSIFDASPIEAPSASVPSPWTAEILQQLFQCAIEKLGERSLTCYIDALDECEESQVREMVDFFENLGEVAALSNIRVHVCFSSRHYPHITIDKSVQLILQDQEGHQDDIAKYLRTKLKGGRSKMLEQIRHDVLDKSSGIFLWVVLVVPMLNQEYDRGRVLGLRKRLKEIPKGLHELFKDILARDNDNMQVVILCIQWILFARRPMRREELYYAILSGTEPEYVTAWDPEELTTSDMDRFLLNSSKGLAETVRSKDKTVQFIHESVRDFLLKENGLNALRSQSDRSFTGNSHEQLKKSCQTYVEAIAPVHPGRNAPLVAASSKEAADMRSSSAASFPFLEYALGNVLYHADAAAGNGCSQDAFLTHFPLQTWLGLQNVLERYPIRRHTTGVTMAYLLAEQGLSHLFRRVIEREPRVIAHQGERYNLPLIAALAGGHHEIIEAHTEIVSYSDEQSEGFLGSPISEVYDHVVSWLLKNGFKAFLPKRDNPLHNANSLCTSPCCSGRLTHLKLLLSQNFICKDKGIISKLLRRAVVDKHEGIVKHLLGLGADPNIDYAPSGSVLENAYENCKNLSDAADLVLCARVDLKPHLKTWELTIPFMSTCEGRIIKLLLDHGAHVSDEYALLMASTKGSVESVKALLSRGTDANSQEALYHALNEGHKDVVELLLQHGADATSQEALRYASIKGHKDVVELLLQHGADANSPGTLFTASRYDRRDVVELLLQHGADANAPDVLEEATRSGHPAVIELLRNYGATRELKAP